MSEIEWTDAAIARFWSKVDRSGGLAACWPWTAAGGGADYGRFRISGRTLLSHRIAVFLRDGVWPADVVMHACDNRACCNPAHLRAASQRENVHDCHEKGRAINLRGEANGKSRLTDELVALIRKRLADGDSLRAIGRDLGVGHTTIANVKLGRTWRAA